MPGAFLLRAKGFRAGLRTQVTGTGSAGNDRNECPNETINARFNLHNLNVV